jgi:hypothetical protein
MSGFIDGEGCFSISFSLRHKFKLGIEVRPSFSVSQKNDINLVNVELFKKFPLFFNCGSLRYSKRDNTYKYEIRNLDQIHTNIIPFFIQYPLFTSKHEDFFKFVSICNKMSQGLHLIKHGLCDIIQIAYTMNLSGKKKFTLEYLLKYLDKVKV